MIITICRGLFFFQKGKEWVRKIRKETVEKVKQRSQMHSMCSYLRLVVFIIWNLRTATEAGREWKKTGSGGGEKEAVCSFTHWCRSRAPCKNSPGYVGHLECRVTSSGCDCAATGLSGACAAPPSSPWAPLRAGGRASEATDGKAAEQDLGSRPHLTRCAPRGIWAPGDAETATAAVSWTLQRV